MSSWLQQLSYKPTKLTGGQHIEQVCSQQINPPIAHLIMSVKKKPSDQPQLIQM
jgi:hypothetical protein